MAATYLDRPAPGLSLEAQAMLHRCAGPGNARELADIMAMSLTACPGATIRGQDPHIVADTPAAPGRPFMTLREMERGHIEEVLQATRWTIEGPQGAAAILGRRSRQSLGLARP